MARTVVAPQVAVPTGLDITLTAAMADGHNFSNDPGQSFIMVKTGASATQITFQCPGKYRGIAMANVVVPLAANKTYLFGPFVAEAFTQSDGTVWFDFTDVTSVTVGHIKMSRP